MGLYKRKLKNGKDADVWWCRFEIGGRKIQRTTGETDRRKAAEKERQLRTYFETNAPRRAARGSVGLADLGGIDCEQTLARGASQHRRDDTEREWTRLCEFFGPETKPSDVTYDRMMAYLGHRRAAGARGQTIVRELFSLKRGLKIAHRNGWLPVLPAEWPKVRRDPKDTKRAGKLHPPAVLARWLEELTPDARDEASIALLTGLRERELKRLTSRWIEPAPAGTGVPAILRIPDKSKTRTGRVVGLVPAAVAILARRCNGLKPDELDKPLFKVGSHKTTYRNARRRIRYHQSIILRDLRHCHATWAAQGTGDAAAAQAALGHTNLATTQRYMSSTLSRTASAAVAVAGLLTSSGCSLPDAVMAEGNGALGKSLQNVELSGEGGGNRTHNLWIKSPSTSLQAHVSQCKSCQLIVAECLRMQTDVSRSGCSDRMQPAPKKGAA